jgi:glycosyltransferase involved in cell wall biosynthesis
MRIGMVSEHASPLAPLGGADAGGQNVHVAELSRALVRLGHEVVVYTRRDSRDLPPRVPTADGVVVEHVPAGPPTAISKDDLLPYMGEFGSYLARRWSAWRPDVVHAHFWLSGLATRYAAAAVGIPWVLTFHALGSVKRRHQGAKDPSPPSRLRVEADLVRAADLVVATCAEEVAELRAMGMPEGRAVVVPCGVDLTTFTPDGPVAPRATRPRILSIGRLVERKGVDTVIRALTAVPAAELVIAGGPAPSKLKADPEVRRLRAVAAECGVTDRVRFVGRVARDAVPALYRSADVVVSVPWYEPFGMVPLEAMACGVPPVVTAVGGHLDTVVDQVTGRFVPPRDSQRLGRVLAELLDDSALRAKLGVAGADRARAAYGWDSVAAQTQAHYARLCAVDPASSATAAGGEP